MGTDEENKNKSFDETRELLKKFYKPDEKIDKEVFWQETSKKIDSLFHREIFLEKCSDKEGKLLSDEERYWFGLEQYVKNEVSSLKHKTITDHLLQCSECRKNYIDLLDKKKEISQLGNQLSIALVSSNSLFSLALITFFKIGLC